MDAKRPSGRRGTCIECRHQRVLYRIETEAPFGVNDLARFFSKTVRGETAYGGTQCIDWVGATNSTGYACFGMHGRSYLAHRLIYEFSTGTKIPEGLTIDHLCENKRCVNALHMEVVTRNENARRRFRRPSGS